MRQDLIAQAIPNADPEFVRIISALPEPPPGAFETVMQNLKTLHDIFIQKRDAAAVGDRGAFDALVDREVALLEKIESAV